MPSKRRQRLTGSALPQNWPELARGGTGWIYGNTFSGCLEVPWDQQFVTECPPWWYYYFCLSFHASTKMGGILIFCSFVGLPKNHSPINCHVVSGFIIHHFYELNSITFWHFFYRFWLFSAKYFDFASPLFIFTLKRDAQKYLFPRGCEAAMLPRSLLSSSTAFGRATPRLVCFLFYFYGMTSANLSIYQFWVHVRKYGEPLVKLAPILWRREGEDWELKGLNIFKIQPWLFSTILELFGPRAA